MTFDAIGTQWEIELLDSKETPEIIEALEKRIEVFDKDYSRFRTDSLVTMMSQKAGVYTLPADAKSMFDLYQELYKLSNGLVTPLIGQALSDAGYDCDYSLKPKAMKISPKWDEYLEYKFPKLLVKKPILLDFGACGKGYLVDIIGELLREHGCKEFVINAGGDILHLGNKAVEIALENPENSAEAIGIASIKNQAICGSAGNKRAWSEYNHILNPITLKSPDSLSAVWVVARTAMFADALTTALYFVSPNELLKSYNFSYALINSDKSLVSSKDFPARFFE
jgi:FAD:protein FMN transferase